VLIRQYEGLVATGGKTTFMMGRQLNLINNESNFTIDYSELRTMAIHQ